MRILHPTRCCNPCARTLRLGFGEDEMTVVKVARQIHQWSKPRVCDDEIGFGPRSAKADWFIFELAVPDTANNGHCRQ